MFRKLNLTTSQFADGNDRPKVQVRPREIGPVTELNENDVLCGRGGRINGHYGNVQFRRICGEKREEYFARDVKKIQKAHIAASVVERIRAMDPPGRFLKQDASGEWWDIGCAKAATKVGQAIREHTPKEEDDNNQNSFLGRLKSATTNSNEPLYPGYDPSQLDGYTQQQPAQPFQQPQVHSNHQVGAPSSFSQDVRRSALSAMSGISTFKSSMVSDVSDVKMSTRSNYNLSLLRESILSDISDCESVRGFMGDSEHLGNRRLSVNSDAHAFQSGAAAGISSADLEPRPFAPTMAMEVTPETSTISKPAGHKAKRSRASSILSLSAASTMSILSIGSATTWGAF